VCCGGRLFIEKLPKHPGYGTAPAAEKTRVRKLLKPALARAMELKEKLKEKFEKEKEELEKLMEQEVMRCCCYCCCFSPRVLHCLCVYATSALPVRDRKA